MMEIFSPFEQEILDAIEKLTTPANGGAITISALVKKLYWYSNDRPLNPNNTVAGSVRRINKKCQHHKLTWYLNGSGRGRQGKTIWKDKRK
jgi:hypothetical protein